METIEIQQNVRVINVTLLAIIAFQVIRNGVPFLNSIILVHLLSNSQYSDFIGFYSLGLLLSLTSVIVGMFLQKEASGFKNMELERIINYIGIGTLIVVFVPFLIVLLMTYTLHYSLYTFGTIITFIISFSLYNQCYFLLIGKEDVRRLIILALLFLISDISGILFVRTWNAALFIISFAYLVSVVVIFFSFVPKITIKHLKSVIPKEINDILHFINESLAILSIIVMITFISRINKILFYIANPVDTSAYYVGLILSEIIIAAASPFSTILLNKGSKKDTKRITKELTLFSILLLIFTIIIIASVNSQILELLFTIRFNKYKRVYSVLIFSSFLNSIAAMIIYFFIGLDARKTAMIFSSYCFFTTILFSFCFINNSLTIMILLQIISYIVSFSLFFSCFLLKSRLFHLGVRNL